jgi:hypothetical protein
VSARRSPGAMAAAAAIRADHYIAEHFDGRVEA